MRAAGESPGLVSPGERDARGTGDHGHDGHDGEHDGHDDDADEEEEVVEVGDDDVDFEAPAAEL